jgi:lysophospholipase L1-like esterase
MNMAGSSDGSAVLMVVTGASYAASWKDPDIGGYRIVNRGVGGEETHQVLVRFDRDVLAQKPAVALIWGHINNIHRAPPGEMARVKDGIRRDYLEMVRRARANGIEPVLATEVTLSEPPGLVNRAVALINQLRGKVSYGAAVNGHVRDINAWLRDYARQEGIRLLDFEKALDDGNGFRRIEYTSGDGTHISPEGYAVLTALARERLKFD